MPLPVPVPPARSAIRTLGFPALHFAPGRNQSANAPGTSRSGSSPRPIGGPAAGGAPPRSPGDGPGREEAAVPPPHWSGRGPRAPSSAADWPRRRMRGARCCCCAAPAPMAARRALPLKGPPRVGAGKRRVAGGGGAGTVPSAWGRGAERGGGRYGGCGGRWQARGLVSASRQSQRGSVARAGQLAG